MKTLYDLLEALPDDDADSIRMAFRKAVKATHPDFNTDDPDAPQRFRRIVRANAILSDPAQRATYDRLLALAIRQTGSKPKRSLISNTIRKFASDAIAVAVLSVVLIGGYTLFGHISQASVVPEKAIEVAALGPAEIAAVTPTAQLDTAGRDNPDDKLENVEVQSETIVTSAVAPAADTGSAQAIADVAPVPDIVVKADVAPVRDIVVKADVTPAPDLAVKDAKSYRERGKVAYRDGDLYLAITDFDLAIQLDPGFADAYIDRGIVFYRMREFGRAFADIAQAKRIENSNRTKTPLPAPQKASASSGKN